MSNPIRMCIGCKKRFPQKELLRFQCKKGELIKYTKSGRSFYICKECAQNFEKKLQKALIGKCKKVQGNKIKEILANG